MRNDIVLAKGALSLLGGIVFGGLFLMSHNSVRDFLQVYEAASTLHLCFGFLLLIVLFWTGFFITWISHSVISWAIDALRYNISYLLKRPTGEAAATKQTDPLVEIATETQNQSHRERGDGQAKDQPFKTAFGQNREMTRWVVSELGPKEPLLTREEFARLINNSGLTINQVAEELGISRQMVSYIIHGKRSMTERISDKARERFSQRI